eukprot:1058932-Pelagomonas_calceolata.AAC.2
MVLYPLITHTGICAHAHDVGHLPTRMPAENMKDACPCLDTEDFVRLPSLVVHALAANDIAPEPSYAALLSDSGQYNVAPSAYPEFG